MNLTSINSAISAYIPLFNILFVLILLAILVPCSLAIAIKLFKRQEVKRTLSTRSIICQPPLKQQPTHPQVIPAPRRKAVAQLEIP